MRSHELYCLPLIITVLIFRPAACQAILFMKVGETGDYVRKTLHGGKAMHPERALRTSLNKVYYSKS